MDAAAGLPKRRREAGMLVVPPAAAWARPRRSALAAVALVLSSGVVTRGVTGVAAQDVVVNQYLEQARAETVLPQSRTFHSAIELSTRVATGGLSESMLIWGGHNGSALIGEGGDSQVLWVFNTTTIEWEMIEPAAGTFVPAARFGHTATKVATAAGDEYMVVVGGAVRTPDGGIAPTGETLVFGPLGNVYNGSWLRLPRLNNATAAPKPRIGHMAVSGSAAGSDGEMLLVTAGLTFDPISANGTYPRNMMVPVGVDEVWVIVEGHDDDVGDGLASWVWERRDAVGAKNARAPTEPARTPTPRGFPAYTVAHGFATVVGGWNGTDVSCGTDEGTVWILDPGSANASARWVPSVIEGAAVPPVALTAASFDNVSNKIFYWGGTAFPRADMLITLPLLEGLPSPAGTAADSYQSQLLFGQATGAGSSFSLTPPSGVAAAMAEPAPSVSAFQAFELLDQTDGARYANEALAPFPRVGQTFIRVGVQSILFGGVSLFVGQVFNSSWAGGIDMSITCTSPPLSPPPPPPPPLTAAAYAALQVSAARRGRATSAAGASNTTDPSQRLWWQLYAPAANEVPPLVHSGAAVATEAHSLPDGSVVPSALWHVGGVQITFTPSLSLWTYITPGSSGRRAGRWTERSISPPDLPTRSFHSATLLGASLMVVFGGRSLEQSGGSSLVTGNMTIGFNLSSAAGDASLAECVPWRELAPAGNGTAASPEPRYGHGAAALSPTSFAVVGGTTVVCTAMCACTGGVLNDSWVWLGDRADPATGAWVRGPALPRSLFGLVVGALGGSRSRVLVAFGGAQSTRVRGPQESLGSCTISPSDGSDALFTWSVDGDGPARWVEVPMQPRPTTPRYFAASAALARKLVVYGGLDGSAAPHPWRGSATLNDTWVLQMGEGGGLEWFQLDVAGGPPQMLGGSAVVHTTAAVGVPVSTLTLCGGLDMGPSGDDENYSADQVKLMRMDLGCNEGFYSPSFADVPCEPCPVGFYANGSGFACCLACGDGTTTLADGASSADDCNQCLATSCNGHGTCTATAGQLQCDCDLLWEDNGRCASLSTNLVAGASVLLVVVVLLALFGVARVRRRLGRYKARNTQYEELIERRDQEVAQLQRAWKIEPTSVGLAGVIAEGSYGEVFRGSYHGFPVAIKMIRRQNRDWDLTVQTEDFQREIGLLRELRHPNIVFFYGAGLWHDNLPFFVTELCHRGSVRSILDDRHFAISVVRAIGFALDAARGVAYLHSRTPPRIHRDIKAANLLVAEDWSVKLADFGSARLLRPERQDGEWVLLDHNSALQDQDRGGGGGGGGNGGGASGGGGASSSSNGGQGAVAKEDRRVSVVEAIETMSAGVGTALWLAPEIMELWARGEESCLYGVAADVYSFGITMWEILTRRVPYQTNPDFERCSIFTMRKLICEGARPALPETHAFPESFVRLMVHCWSRDDARRPPAGAICDALQTCLVEAGGPAQVALSTANAPLPPGPNGGAVPVVRVSKSSIQ